MTRCAIALLLLICSHGIGTAEERWLGDYAAARTAARQSGKPLFVVFRCEH